MDISGLRRFLPNQATESAREKAGRLLYGGQLKGTLKEPAVEQLATVPEPWLDRLVEEGVAYVALGYGEDLSQTELITSYTPEKLAQDAAKAKPLIAQAKAEVEQEIAETTKGGDELTAALAERERPQMLRERLRERFNEAEIGFDVKEVKGDKPLLYLEQEHNVEPTDYDEFLEPQETEQGLFRTLLVELNGPEVVKSSKTNDGRYILADDTVLDPQDDVLVIPYGVYGGKRLSEVSKESYSSINGMGMDQHLGAHYWPNRLIVVDDDVVSLPSSKTSYHSVLLHETGHCIDHLAEQYQELNHREMVDSLYAQDLQRYRQGDNRFLTARAMDNAGEYFAEAVEAYLTQPVEGVTAGYKVENESVALKERNPELYAHVERVLAFDPPARG